MIPEYTLNAEAVRGMMLDVMERHLSLKTEGYRSTTNETFNLLLKAAAEGSSLEAVCADSCGAMASNTLREQLNAALDASRFAIPGRMIFRIPSNSIAMCMRWGIQLLGLIQAGLVH
jgi:hypothetical protein